MQSILKEPLLLVSLGGLREFNQGQILRALFPRENKQRNQTKDKLYFAFFFFLVYALMPQHAFLSSILNFPHAAPQTLSRISAVLCMIHWRSTLPPSNRQTLTSSIQGFWQAATLFSTATATSWTKPFCLFVCFLIVFNPFLIRKDKISGKMWSQVF